MSSTEQSGDLSRLLELEAELSQRLESAKSELERRKADAESVRATRIAVQRKVEELERTHNAITSNIVKLVDEYERLDALSDRATNAMALKPPPLPTASRRALRAIKDVPLLRQHLCQQAQDISTEDPICGVYFLLQDSEVVYVGQSINVLSRVVTHATERVKEFNRWCYVEVKRQQLDEVEKFYIRLLMPPLNIAGKPVLRTDILEVTQ